MSDKISYPAALRARAKAETRDLFACGMDGAGGSLSIKCSMPRGEASKLAFFCIKVSQGMTPGEAFKKAYQP